MQAHVSLCWSSLIKHLLNQCSGSAQAGKSDATYLDSQGGRQKEGKGGMSNRNRWRRKRKKGKKRLFSYSDVKHSNFHIKIHGIPAAFTGMGSERECGVSKGGEGSDSRKQPQGSNINPCNVIFAALIFVVFLLFLPFYPQDIHNISLGRLLSPWQLPLAAGRSLAGSRQRCKCPRGRMSFRVITFHSQ